MFEDSVDDRIDKAGASLADTEKGEGEGKEGENDEIKKRSVDGGKQGSSIKKVKKDKAGSATGKNAKPEANAISAAPRIVQYVLESTRTCDDGLYKAIDSYLKVLQQCLLCKSWRNHHNRDELFWFGFPFKCNPWHLPSLLFPSSKRNDADATTDFC